MILLLAACSQVPAPVMLPPGVPSDVLVIHYSGNDLLVNSTRIGPSAALTQGHLQRDHEPLLSVLKERHAPGAWITLPSTASWAEVRRTVHTALSAGIQPVWISPLGEPVVFGPIEPTATDDALFTCRDGAYPIIDTSRRLSLELHADDAQSWVLAAVRLIPVVDTPGGPVPAPMLPKECWAIPQCAGLTDRDLHTCTVNQAKSAPSRIPIAGPVGCILPLGKGAEGHRDWIDALPKSLDHLGLRGVSETLLLVDDNVSFGAAASMISGLRKADIQPQVSWLQLGSNSGPPVCSIPTTSSDQLDAAAARWLATLNQEKSK